jgi:transcription-repair coupling factor (superfamily II helicase)
MAFDLILQPIKRASFLVKTLSALDRKETAIISGLPGSASSAIGAALLEHFPNILLVVATGVKAETVKTELDLFSGKEAKLFPAPDIMVGMEPSKDLIGERLAILDDWDRGEGGVVVAPAKALGWKTLPKEKIKNLKLKITRPGRVLLHNLIEKLILLGYRRFDIVGGRGEFSVRGGLIDIFPLNLEHPVRIELAGDEVESIRSFDAYSQRSINRLNEISVLPAHELYQASLFEHLPPNCLMVFEEMLEIENALRKEKDAPDYITADARYLDMDEIQKGVMKFRRLELSAFLRPGEEIPFLPPAEYIGKFSEIPKESVIISKHASRLKTEIEANIFEGSIRGGFVFDGLQVLSDKELFGEQIVSRRKKMVSAEGVADDLLADLKLNDYVVHENYGIGIYRGTDKLDWEGVIQEYFEIEFAGGDRVYVPPSMAGLVEKYSGGGEVKPKLSRLGTKLWLKTKNQVKKTLREMTQELLALYAARQKFPGYPFPGDDIWQVELEGTFSFEETPDQLKAINDTKRDMESTRPMDRLVCGDVGYGKTEVAIRAAVKAVSAGKQVAILVPTTILAEQHYNNFKNRLKSFPFIAEMLSRFRSKKEQANVIKALAGGGVDIVIGTHRLLSKDVKFNDLGLLIVDEEQRFGVAHKEKLKKMRQTVDVLSLSATPIPRTLYLSLSGARDMSVINTPPVDRSPIRTYVLPWNEAVIREAIRREMDRGGQVYFVHNFVESIEGMASKIKKLVPEAKVAIGHGQMSEKTLEKTMLDFMEKKCDVLVCTSIIESGLDITNVNTILIDQADRLGLSQLYQIRGRVGRSPVRAYAYLFYHPEKVIAGQALERLKAIQEFTALGSGYKLAMRDLEIRGSGNLLGAEQSGHILEVGFDLYCELLEEAVKEIKGIKEVSPRVVEIDLKLEAYIPDQYISDDRQRLAIYRRMNLIDKQAAVNDLKKELIDRFGNFPVPVNKLFDLLNLKMKALKAGVVSIKEEDSEIMIEWLSGKRKRAKVQDKDKIKLVEKFF